MANGPSKIAHVLIKYNCYISQYWLIFSRTNQSMHNAKFHSEVVWLIGLLLNEIKHDFLQNLCLL